MDHVIQLNCLHVAFVFKNNASKAVMVIEIPYSNGVTSVTHLVMAFLSMLRRKSMITPKALKVCFHLKGSWMSFAAEFWLHSRMF